METLDTFSSSILLRMQRKTSSDIPISPKAFLSESFICSGIVAVARTVSVAHLPLSARCDSFKGAKVPRGENKRRVELLSDSMTHPLDA
jgi:hypothetical protein